MGGYSVLVAIGLRVLQGMGASMCLSGITEALSIFLPADLRAAVPIMGGCSALGLLLGPVCSGYLYHDEFKAWAACGVLGGLFLLPALAILLILPAESCGCAACFRLLGRVCCLGCSCVGRCRKACVRAWGYEYDRPEGSKATTGHAASDVPRRGGARGAAGKATGRPERVYRRLRVDGENQPPPRSDAVSLGNNDPGNSDPGRPDRIRAPALPGTDTPTRPRSAMHPAEAKHDDERMGRSGSFESVASITSDLFLGGMGGGGSDAEDAERGLAGLETTTPVLSGGNNTPGGIGSI